MGKERDPNGIVRIGTELEEARRLRERNVRSFILGMSFTLSAPVGIYYAGLDPRLLLATTVIGGAWTVYKGYRWYQNNTEITYNEGRVQGIAEEAQRTATLQRPQN